MSLAFHYFVVFVLAVTQSDSQQLDSIVSESTSSPGLELASKQLPELLPVLDHLRVKSPQRYEKAIRDLDRSAKKLQSIYRRDAKLFDIAMREWKTRGQIDLLKAKLRVKNSEQDQQAILQSLQSLHDAELERVERELALLDERKLACEERIQQAQQLIERENELRKQLNEKRSRLVSESIDENSHVYLKATGSHKTEPNRLAPSIKSKKATNDE